MKKYISIITLSVSLLTYLPELSAQQPNGYNNAGVANIDTPLTYCSGINPIYATIQNYGKNSINTVQINWEFNSVVQTPLIFTQLLDTSGGAGNSTSQVLLGSKNFVNGVQNDIKCWTSHPNLSSDTINENDTLNVVKSTGLSGIYTIGGSTASFPDFTSAINQLDNFGVCGWVLFEVNSGTYNESLVIHEISGMNSTNTIEFVGVDKSTTKIISGTAGVPTIHLLGADHVTFRNFTIQHTASTDAFAILLNNDARSNTIDSCIISLVTGSNSDVAGIVASNSTTSVSSEGNNCSNLIVSNCIIDGGLYGIRLEGNGTNLPTCTGNVIVNNELMNGYTYGIYTDNQDSLIIQENTILGLFDTQSEAIYMDDSEYFEIVGNTLNSMDHGIYISDANFNSGRRAKIVNNMIIGGSDDGIEFDDARNIDVFHNTVIGGRSGVHFDDYNGMDVRNNIFGSTSSVDHAFECDQSFGFANIDYNIYFNSGTSTRPIDYNNTTYSSLLAWQTAIPAFNVNSIEDEPTFVSNDDLHVIGCLVDGVGDNSVGVAFDIDNDLRPYAPTVTVDIGADEIPTINNDAAISNISLEAICAGSTADLIVVVTNHGCSRIDSLDLVFDFNGSSSSINHKSIIESGERDTVLLANLSIPSSPNPFYDIKVWVASPNGSPDNNNSNDTLQLRKYMGLSGNYTIGLTNADFVDFTSAVNRLETSGICGPVEFSVQSGTYNEAITLTDIEGVNSTNTITFNGIDRNTRTLISSKSLEATILFNNSNNIIVKNLTIQQTATVDAWGILFQNGSHHIIIDSCNILMEEGNVSDVVGIGASNALNSKTSEGNNASFVVLSNNSIKGGEEAIHLEGNGISVPVAFANQILNNDIKKAYDYGIYTDDQDSLIIHGNKITEISSAQSEAIYMDDVEYFEIVGNTLNGLDHGIYMIDANFNSGLRAKVINNMILGGSDDGIEFDDARNIDVFHNTVIGGRSGVHFDDYNGMDVRNNIFGSTSSADHAFECDQSFGFTNIDYNIYFNSGSSASLIDYSNITYPSLQAWQTAITAFNANSIEGEPKFLSNEDLHILDTLPNDVGDNSVGISSDIDYDLRPLAPSTTVDIGADEYNPKEKDVAAVNLLFDGLCGDSMQLTSAVIYNYGIHSQSGFLVSSDVVGLTSTFISAFYLDTLKPFTYDTLLLGFANTYAGGIYNTATYTALLGDANVENDTVKIDRELLAIPNPSYDPAIICTGDSIELVGDQPEINDISWYLNKTDTVPIHVGGTFQTGPLSSSTTYYVEAITNAAESFGTMPALNGGNGSNGITFNLSASADLVVDSIATTPYANGTVDMWYNPTPINGKPTISAANGWVLLGSTSVVGQGSSSSPILQVIPIPVGITIPANSTYGFYIGGVNIAYTTYNASNGDPYMNDYLTIHTGTNVGYGGSTQTNHPRQFNGEVYYSAQGCEGPRNPYEVIVAPNAPEAKFNSTAQGSLVQFEPNTTDIITGYSWDFGDGTTSNEKNPTHDYINGGQYNVCLTVINPCGQDQYCEAITVVGIENYVENNPSIQIYPNPSTDGIINIDVNNFEPGRYALNVYNSLLQNVYHENINIMGDGLLEVNMGSLQNGIYIIELKDSKLINKVSQKLIIQSR